ncbi:ER lumen protein retaining receptor-domain-containing protein [Aspergillus alliaceus]|uniref:ER lumen protein retaining receptor-domain-containing protein n=2 Tax=Petromyces alliaceus TaxID=209559 RepID=A0A5N7CDA4_PETAA|nr:ER lumen protein retaining receptor-domain-containing protein [Aspergillus alliaceus]KAB8232949.1 ER lumen protein retaining receptor-domain-containing protein [Aspergillus alliaceus]KAE8391899.1 ER lumen protein retaining receptor-domain-containing protein [Aspergillus alliaceus]
MGLTFNIFRILGDTAHISSKCILIWAIHRNKSAEGVSLLTQVLYAMVFVTRYLDLFRLDGWRSFYLVFFKFFYILSSGYIIFLMMKMFPRTRERERAWKLALGSVAASLVLAPILTRIFNHPWPYHWFTEIWWAFSIVLESVCVLPQLLLLRQTTVPTVIDSYYLLTLGSYRAFYILNWLLRGFGEHHWDPIADIFGVVQTAFYIDFAWVYYTRQRVKLRNGGVVDSEDFRNSWLVNKVLTFRQRQSVDEEQHLHNEGAEDGHEAEGEQPRNNRWGARGISISADDTLSESRRPKSNNTNEGDDRLEGFLEDEEDTWDEHASQQAQHKRSPDVADNRN